MKKIVLILAAFFVSISSFGMKNKMTFVKKTGGVGGFVIGKKTSHLIVQVGDKTRYESQEFYKDGSYTTFETDCFTKILLWIQLKQAIKNYKKNLLLNKQSK